MHVTHADLRAFLDEELPAAERARAAEHLAGCPDCRVRLTGVAEQAQRVQARLATLAPGAAEVPQPAHLFRSQIQNRQRKDGVSMVKSIFARRSVWAGLAAVAALAVAFSFAPVRAWAGQFLGLFRVEQIQVVSLDTSGLGALAENATLSEQISQLFADNVNVVHEPANPVVVASLDEASAMTGFTVRTLSAGSVRSVITVRDRMAFEVTADRDRAQAILDEAGRSDLVLPESLDGATVSVEVPTGATVAYGECPTGTEAEFAYDPDSPAERPTGRGSFRSCVLFAQIPSPTVNAPADLDVGQLAEVALQFAGMTAEEAHDFSQTVDWTSTLVVPLPREAAAYEQVQVDGVTGTLVYEQRASNAEQMYMLMWVKDGVVYGLQAFGLRGEVLALANSVR
jgi:anti-sigma factor RsiW